MRKPLIIAAFFALPLVLTGCMGLTTSIPNSLSQGKPIGMWNRDCEGFVVQSGLPIPLGQRMPELDGLCPLPKSTLKP